MLPNKVLRTKTPGLRSLDHLQHASNGVRRRDCEAPAVEVIETELQGRGGLESPGFQQVM